MTPDTKVPTIESPFLPDFSQGGSYWEWCEDSDYAWRPQSLPNRKYVPERSTEHEARVRLFLQRIKAFVSADVDDWVPYVNEMLGVELPTAKVDRTSRPQGTDVWGRTTGKSLRLKTFGVSAEYVYVAWATLTLANGQLSSSSRSMSIQLNGSPQTLCVTPIDLQAAFEGQRGYVFRPYSFRTARLRPSDEELTKLGGQWFGYDVHVFADAATGPFDGQIGFGFGFRPCASHISIKLTKKFETKETK